MKKRKQKDLPRSRKPWTTKETALLRKLYPDRFTRELVELLGRSRTAIIIKARRLGIRKNWRKYSPVRPCDCKLWTPKEIDRLTRLYAITPIQQLILRFPRRSKNSIVGKAHALGLKKNYMKSILPPTNSEPILWGKQKKRLLDLYPTMSNQELAKKFGHSENSIRSLAWSTGIHKAGYTPDRKKGIHKFWSKEEDALLKKLYPTAWTKEIAARLGRTKDSVMSRAVVLGLKKDPEKFTLPPHPKAWSDEDIKKLWQLWQKGLKILQIAELIGKSQESVSHEIKRQKQKFGLPERQDPNKWSQEQTGYLIKHYKNQSARQIADRLGRKPDSIYTKAGNLGLTEPACQPWTSREKNFLIKYYPQWTASKIAKILGKTLVSVQNKTKRLGLGKK